jgi:hypothetical protein
VATLRVVGYTRERRPDLRRSCAGGPSFSDGFLSVDKSVVRPIAHSRRPLAPIYLAAVRTGVGAGRRSRHSAPIPREQPRMRRRFVNRHFSLIGTLRLYRRAIGWDLLRVPVLDPEGTDAGRD